MNCIFSIVWSWRRAAMPVSAGALNGTILALGIAIVLGAPSLARAQSLPTDGQVVEGTGSIHAPVAGALAIEQASQRMAIDWQQFNIGAGNTVRFNQPGADAVALNRVLGPDGSQILGQLQANGRVFLVNPNGVLFGRDAQVDVGGLVASTLNISNADFMAGNYRFQGGPNGAPAAVINQGRISAAEGGAVALLGGQVHNQGVIQARLGTVALAAGNAVTLDFAGDGLLNVQVDQAAKDALVDNGQLIQADGGQVLMTAHASDALLQTVVNNTGVIEARTLENREGKIVLLGDFSGGTVKVAGTLDAGAPNGGDGGFIDTSGAYVQVADGVKVTTLAPQGKTGMWLIDPTDFTVSEGAAPWTDSGIGAVTLSNNLATTDIELETAPAGIQEGDIHVNAPISWNGNTSLTLTAHRDININASITATGEADFRAYAGRDIAVNDAVSVTGDGGIITMSADEGLTINGSVSVIGDQGVVLLAGGDLSLNATMSVTGDSGAIFLAACGDLSCGQGNIDVNGQISVQGADGSVAMTASGAIEINDVVSVTGDRGVIDLGGDNSVSIDGTLLVAGEGGQIFLQTCNCDPTLGDIAINGDVAVQGDDGFIFMQADGGLTLNGAVSTNSDETSYIALTAVRDITDTATTAITTNQLDAVSDDGKVALDNGVHRVGLYNGSARNDLAFTNNQALWVGEVSTTGDGNIVLRTTTGDLTLLDMLSAPTTAPEVVNGVVRAEGAGDIDVVSAGGFHNQAGSGALQTNDGDWRVWSQNPAQNELGGLTYDFKQYNAQYGSSAVLGQGNGVLYTLAPVLDVGLQGQVIKTYDGTDTATLGDANYVQKGGLVGGDRATLFLPTQARYSDKNAGTSKAVTVDGLSVLEAAEIGSGVKVYGYQINASASGDIGQINQRAITVAADDLSKNFGTADPTFTWRMTQGELVAGDAFAGALTRNSGEAPGAYAILQGDLSAGGNYALTVIDGRLVITEPDIYDPLGDLEAAYQAALVTAKTEPQGPAAFDKGGDTGGSATPYTIEDEGQRLPEGI